MLRGVTGRIWRQDALEDVWIRHLRVHEKATVVVYVAAKVERAGLADRIEIRKVEPGPMSLLDASVKFVFSKDSIVHIPDKETLAADAFRVLKPGGWLVVSDWLISHDEEPSPEMADYIARKDLDFGMGIISLSHMPARERERESRTWNRRAGGDRRLVVSGPCGGVLPPKYPA